MIKENAVLYGIIGLLGGIVLTVCTMQIMGIRSQNTTPERQIVEKEHGMGMESSMDEMMDSMKTEKGEEFDKAFIEAMIPHHQGAIEMAKEAQKNASHEEIKKLADDIIAAQTEEITLMEQWKKNWGY